MRSSHLLIGVCLGLVVPTSVGLLSGWLVGLSATPVVAAVIPLVFGLLGIAGIGTVARWLNAGAIIETLVKTTTLKDSETEKVRTVSEEAVPERGRGSVVATSSVSIAVFCLAFYIGIQNGIKQRITTYPPLSDMIKPAILRPYEAAALARLRIDWSTGNVPHRDFKELIDHSFAPIFEKRQEVYDETVYGRDLAYLMTYEDVRYHEFYTALTAARGTVMDVAIAANKKVDAQEPEHEGKRLDKSTEEPAQKLDGAAVSNAPPATTTAAAARPVATATPSSTGAATARTKSPDVPAATTTSPATTSTPHDAPQPSATPTSSAGESAATTPNSARQPLASIAPKNPTINIQQPKPPAQSLPDPSARLIDRLRASRGRAFVITAKPSAPAPLPAPMAPAPAAVPAK